MTVAAAFGVVSWRTHLAHHRLPKVQVQVRYSNSQAAVDSVGVTKDDGPVSKVRKEPEWKKFDSKELGVKMSSISKPTRLVLSGLRKKGYEVYLVGGCVRDLILKRIPKDFDIITSAQLKEVRNTFPHCQIVGKRFPICHVHVNDTTVEVSSFSTCGSTSNNKFDNNFRRPPGCNRHDFIRWRNCLQRDFTINGLMFDPYAKIVYDYMGGIQDIRKAKMRTVVPANDSFVEDCARILRAIRIAARLGFSFTKDLALSVKELSWSIKRLDKGRILMEMNYMLAFGSSEASMRLLWRFGLLERLLPVQARSFSLTIRILFSSRSFSEYFGFSCFIQASYFASQGFRRRDESSNMLLSLFSNLDKLVAPNQPCHSSVWIAILAFHKALVDQPRDPLVVAALSLAISSGGSLSEAVEVARTISQPHETMFNEILEPVIMPSKDALIDEVLDLAASVKAVLCKMTDRDYVSQAMIKFPKAPRSDLVFIPLALSLRVSKIFQCIRRKLESGYVPKIGKRINYESLALGSLPEVQNMFATVVFNTVYPVNRKQ